MRHAWLGVVGFGLLCFLVIFGPGLDNNFVADDWFFLAVVSRVQTLPQVLAFFTFDTDWFVRPVQWLTTFGLYQGFGVNPAPYHLVSLVLTLANSILLTVIAYKLVSSAQDSSDAVAKTLAILTGALFTFSAPHHEAVFWYSSINEVLATFFKFLAILGLLYAVRASGARRWLSCALALAAYVMALFSKESAITFPVEMSLLLLYIRLAEPKNQNWRQSAMLPVPFFAITLLWLSLYLARVRADAISSLGHGGLVLQQGTLLDWVFKYLFFFNHHYIGTDFVFDSVNTVFIELLVLFSLAGLAIFRRKYLWLFALAWTIVALGPYVMIETTQVLSWQNLKLGAVPDRYLYYSAAGASLLLAATLQWIVEGIKQIRGNRYMPGLATAVLVILVVSFLFLNMTALVEAEGNWDTAGKTYAALVRDLAGLRSKLGQDGVLCVEKLPKNYKGKYIFGDYVPGVMHLFYGQSYFEVLASANNKQTALYRKQCSMTLEYEMSTNTLIAHR